MEKRTKARERECPTGTTKTIQTPAAAYNIKECIQGLEEDASKIEVRKGDVSNCGTEQGNAHSQHLSRSRRQHRTQGAPWLLRDTFSVSASSRGGILNWGNEQNSHQLTMMRGKINLLIFKDEKTKDAVTYHLWWWDITIFHCLGLDDQHLLLYIFQSLQGFPGGLAGSLGEDATLTNILQMLDKHCGLVMTFNALSKELYSSSKVPGRMWPSLRCTCCSRFRYFSQSTWEGFNRRGWRRWSEIVSMRAWTSNIGACWPTKWMVNTLLATPTCSLQPRR